MGCRAQHIFNLKLPNPTKGYFECILRLEWDLLVGSSNMGDELFQEGGGCA